LDRQQVAPSDSTRLEAVITLDELLEAMETIKKVYVSEPVKRYAVDLVNRTRQTADVYLGASPRGSLALFRTGQASAALAGAITSCRTISRILRCRFWRTASLSARRLRLRELSAERLYRRF